MGAPLSMDIRKRIVQSWENGNTFAQIAREKNVAERTIYKIIARYKETGNYAPRPLNNGRKPCLSDELQKQIESRIIAQPDITLDEIIEAFKLDICRSALSKIVRFKLGFRYKKKPSRQWEVKSTCD
jgi:transposase